MRKRKATKVVSSVLAATVAGFSLGASSLVWRLFAIFTAAWLTIWIGGAIFLLYTTIAPTFQSHVGVTVFESLGIIGGFIAVTAIVLITFPEIWIIVLGPPVLLFLILNFFDFVFSPHNGGRPIDRIAPNHRADDA